MTIQWCLKCGLYPTNRRSGICDRCRDLMQPKPPARKRKSAPCAEPGCLFYARYPNTYCPAHRQPGKERVR